MCTSKIADFRIFDPSPGLLGLTCASIVVVFLSLFILNGISKKYFFLPSAWNDWPNVNVSNEFHLKTCLARVWPCSDSKYHVHLCFFQGSFTYYVLHLILCLNLAPSKVTEEGCRQIPLFLIWIQQIVPKKTFYEFPIKYKWGPFLSLAEASFCCISCAVLSYAKSASIIINMLHVDCTTFLFGLRLLT